MGEERGEGGEGSQVDDEVRVGGDGRGLGELVCLRGLLEHGVDVTDVDDGLERHRAAAAEGERLAPFLGGRRRLPRTAPGCSAPTRPSPSPTTCSPPAERPRWSPQSGSCRRPTTPWRRSGWRARPWSGADSGLSSAPPSPLPWPSRRPGAPLAPPLPILRGALQSHGPDSSRGG